MSNKYSNDDNDDNQDKCIQKETNDEESTALEVEEEHRNTSPTHGNDLRHGDTTQQQNIVNSIAASSNVDIDDDRDTAHTSNHNDDADDDDGPRFMEDEDDLASRRIRQTRMDAKSGAVVGPSLLTATMERRNVPTSLRNPSTSTGNNSVMRKTRTTESFGAVTPGAVAVNMAGRPPEPTNRVTTTVDPERMRDIASSDAMEALPQTLRQDDLSANEMLAPSLLLSSPKSPTRIPSTAERRIQRQPRSRRPPEETKQEESTANSRVVIEPIMGIVAAPTPMEDAETTVTGESDNADIEANDTIRDYVIQPLEPTIDAELVVSLLADPEEERRKLQEQAELAAKEKILSNTPEAQVINDDEERYRAKRWKYLAIIIVFVLVITVAVLGLKLTREIAMVSCQTAIGPLNFTDFNFQIEGNTAQRNGEFIGSCQVEHEGGYGNWYYLTGDGSRLLASTCQSENSRNSDTEILVYSGGCENLTCVGGSDELCGAHGAVGWFAESDIDYQLLVRGNRASFDGDYILIIEKLEQNGQCQNATELEPTGNISSSTRGLTENNSIFVDTCNSQENFETISAGSPAGAWFNLVDKNDTVKCAILYTEAAAFDFPVLLSVYSGDCEKPKCVEQTSFHALIWQAFAETSYFLRISGDDIDNMDEKDGAQNVGDFILEVRDVPRNSICGQAQVLEINQTQNGTTVETCRVQLDACDWGGKNSDRRNVNLHGVWFELTGTGNFLELHILEVKSDVQAPIELHLSLFDASEGLCETQQCMDVPLEQCHDVVGKKMWWLSSKGTLYRLLVQSSIEVNFAIDVQDHPPTMPDTCSHAGSLTSYDSKFFAFGSTNGASLDTNPASCIPSEPGVFFKTNGTGTSMIASTCHTGTSQPTAITILTGDCDSLVCVESNVTTCDGVHPVASWPSVSEQEYYVHIAGDATKGQDSFVLSVREGNLGEPNNFCANATPVALNNSEIGSTINASHILEDYVDLCEDRHLAGPGVWYSFAGIGSSVTASLCGDITKFDTQLRIYSGDCTSLQCVSYNDDSGCGPQSEVTWQAVEGIQYYILVSGVDDEIGDFELSITSS